MLRTFHCLLLLLLATAAGCQHFDLRRKIPWKPEPGENVSQPKKVVGIWTDAVQHQPGKPPIRGFGGRIVFYGEEPGKAIKVDGQVVVYAFDDTNPQAPKRRYVFPAEQLQQFYGDSPLGPSYNLWLPWDEAGGVRKDVSLIVRFEPKDGPMIVAEATRQHLPGADPNHRRPEILPAGYPAPNSASAPAAQLVAVQTGTYGGQQVNYQAEVVAEPTFAAMQPSSTSSAAPTPLARRMETATIALPPSLSERMQQASVWQTPHHAVSNSAGGEATAAAAIANSNLPGPVPTTQAEVTRLQGNSSPEMAQESTPAASATRPRAHFGWGRHRVLGQPIVEPSRDRAPWRPSHAG